MRFLPVSLANIGNSLRTMAFESGPPANGNAKGMSPSRKRRFGFCINNAPAYFKSVANDGIAGASIAFIAAILAGILFLIHKHRKLWEQIK